MNLLRCDRTRYYNLPAQGIVCLRELRDGLGGTDEAMSLSVMAQPNLLPRKHLSVMSQWLCASAQFHFAEPGRYATRSLSEQTLPWVKRARKLLADEKSQLHSSSLLGFDFRGLDSSGDTDYFCVVRQSADM